MKSTCWMIPLFNALPHKMRVALPVCARDWMLMLKNLDWQAELENPKDFDCVLSVDREIPDDVIRELERAAWRAFSKVEVFIYPTAPVKSWPQAPNWAFQHTAIYMQPAGRAWFWMEPDCVPLQPGWLDAWNEEYVQCHKLVMGVIVRGMGHCNGTAVYPANFPRLSRAAMTCVDDAWDGVMKKDTILLTHDASHLLCHVWGIERGRAKWHGGEAAHFSSWHDVQKWVDMKAVLFHRCKDGSLIDQLQESVRSFAPA